MRKLILPTLAVLFSAAVATEASANCIYPQKRVKQHWGYYNTQGNPFCPVVIGPSTPFVLIGEEIVECDGSTSSWGLTTCPDYNRVTTEYTEPCEPICNDPMAADAPKPEREKPVKRAPRAPRSERARSRP